jgi:hypothetical protein
LHTVDDYARASAAGGCDAGDAHLTRTNLRFDAKGREAAAKACEKLVGELDRIEEAAEKRFARIRMPTAPRTRRWCCSRRSS